MVRLKIEEWAEGCKVYNGDITANVLFEEGRFAFKKIISKAQRVIPRSNITSS